MRYWRTAAQDKYGGPGAEDLLPGIALDMFLIGRWGVANRMTLIIESLMVDEGHPWVGMRASQPQPKAASWIGSLTTTTPLTRALP